MNLLFIAFLFFYIYIKTVLWCDMDLLRLCWTPWINFKIFKELLISNLKWIIIKHFTYLRKIVRLTWNLRMTVQIRPRVNRELPSTISWAPIFSRWTLCSWRKVRALSTFSRQWILIFPFVGRGWWIKKNNNNYGCSRQ